MAALMRSVLRCSRLIAVQLPGNIQVRRDVRALRRTPVRVIPPERERRSQTQERGPLTQQKDKRQESGPLTQETDKRQKTGPLMQKDKRQERGPLTQQKGQPQEQQRYQPVSEDRSQKKDRADETDVPQKVQPQELKYERARPGENRLSKVVSIAKSKSFRDRHGQVLLEGQRLLLDALETGAILQTLFFSRVDQLKALPTDKLQKANLIKVKFEDIKLWSDVVTPQGVMGIFRKPDHVKMKYPEDQLKNTLPMSLICDNIRDPGNLGTILRCAAGAGCNKVLLTKGCVDAWEPKVIRAGMGAHFRLPIITSLDWDTISNYLSEDTKVFLADNFWKNVSDEEEFKSGKAIDYGWISNDPRSVGYIEGEDYYSSGDEGDEELQDIPKIPIQHYHHPWAKGPSAIVIGGETRGLSIESLLLAENSGGRRLYISVVPGIESLNSAMAASILLFEGRKQMQEKSFLATHGKQ
ncbi:PREDICTED: rRNA methyltransferase 3, mitochondrial [Nanorana parkeri]|uniref:rRNA methyltransferase 3, mitochondrial n=1 Tax=Nanorana parkeri TaxID=125878 RepID=UPI0008549D5D|nr:PREDICTED: rRNA methyltransferase 3, mitochondrial [Nanorana parkeri]